MLPRKFVKIHFKRKFVVCRRRGGGGGTGGVGGTTATSSSSALSPTGGGIGKMSTGKRLAKRSIIGTRVCAMGADHLWYSGVIQAVKTPANHRDNNNCINLTPDTKYSVRFDLKQDMSGMTGFGPPSGGGGGGGAGQPRRLVKEYRETELIGPGFQSVMSVALRPGQKVFLTLNGRESAGEVLAHDVDKDEVSVQVTAVPGQEVRHTVR